MRCHAGRASPASSDDGRIEIDSNIVERAIRPIALNRKNALFAGSDGGGEHWAVIASLVETAKLNAVDPQAYLADILTKIVNGHPQAVSTSFSPGPTPNAASEPWPENSGYSSSSVAEASTSSSSSPSDRAVSPCRSERLP